jgi:hypothetical protein
MRGAHEAVRRLRPRGPAVGEGRLWGTDRALDGTRLVTTTVPGRQNAADSSYPSKRGRQVRWQRELAARLALAGAAAGGQAEIAETLAAE